MELKNTLKMVLMLALITAGLILLALWRLEWKPMPVMGLGHALNDQVQYIAGARNWIEQGKLETTVIYPSTLAQNTKTKILYVPGHYGMLALAFFMFGVHFWSSILFSSLGFIFIVVATYLCGQKIFDKKTALIAAIITLLFPFNLLFSLTAMAEMNVIASSLAALLIFLYLPRSWAHRLAPLIAMIPICFRETSLILIFPLAALIWRETEPEQRPKAVAKFCVSSLVLFVLFNKVFFGGRPDLIKANVFGDMAEIYSDASFSSTLKPSMLDWVTTCAHKFMENAWALVSNAKIDAEPLAMKLLLVVSIFVVLRGIRRRDVFGIGIGVMSLVLFGAVFAIYAVTGFRGLRVLLVLVPFLSLGMGQWLSSSQIKTKYVVLLLMVFGLASFRFGFWKYTMFFPGERERESKIVKFIESLKPDKSKIFIGPFWFVKPWVHENYPVRFSILPSNPYSFRLVQQVAPIGTIVLHESELSVLSQADLKMLGFDLIQEANFDGIKFLVFKPLSKIN